MIIYQEPDKQGNCITVKRTREEVVRVHRKFLQDIDRIPEGIILTDQQIIDDYIVMHWAWEI